MTFLYSCRHSGDQYRITKLSPELDVESSYLCTLAECECPQGHRPICRHRTMLPLFLARGAIDTHWFYDYDRGGWVQVDLSPDNAAGATKPGMSIEPLPSTNPFDNLPDGVVVLDMDDRIRLHNAIADAVGEPKIVAAVAPAPHPLPTIRRRV